MIILRRGIIPTVVQTYTGPGDIMTGALWWVGLRAYSFSSITSNPQAVDIVDQSGGNQITVNVLSDGSLDTTTINSWVTAHSVTTILISKLYDQTGNGNHFTQTTNANRPSLVLNSIGTHNRPAIKRTASTSFNVSCVNTITQIQPHFISGVYRCDTANGAFADVLSAGNNYQIGFANILDDIFIYLGSSIPTTGATHGLAHAIQWTLQSSTSEMYVDGTSSGNVNPGGLGLSSSTLVIPGDQNAGEGVSIGEQGFWTTTSSVKSQLDSNQRTTWYGF